MFAMLVRADLHVHSVYSDGKASPREIIATAAEKGLKVISITDHDTFAGSLMARKISTSYDVLVIPGVEVRTEHGDVLLYCETEINFPRKVDHLIDVAHANNCIVVPAHPFDVLRLGIGDYIYEFDGWDAIEVWNASANKRANYKAIEAAKVLGKPGIANSDAHLPEEIGAAYNYIEVPDLKIDDVLEAIRRNRVRPIFHNISIGSRFKRILWSMERSIRNSMGGFDK